MFYVPVTVQESLPGIGKGVFSVSPIVKGCQVFTLDGPYISWKRAKQLGRQNHVIPVSHTAYADMPLENRVNHSCDPNLGFLTATTVIACKDIRAGDELTWDYSCATADDWTMNCLCGLPSCRKVIGNYVDLPPEAKKRLNYITPQWVRDLDHSHYSRS